MPMPDLSTAERRLLHALKRRRGREEHGLFLAEGIRVVEDLIDSDVDLHLAVLSSSMEDTPRGQALQRLLAGRAAVRRVAAHEIERLAATETPQGVVVAARMPVASLEGYVARERELVLVLDAVQDPGNLGTLLRSAEAFGAGLVVTLPGTVDPWNPKTVRSAAGSSFRVPVAAAEAPVLRSWLTAQGFVLYGAEVGGAGVETLPRAARVALAVGNEGAGLTQELSALADARVGVAIRGRAESLNVGVAAGILLYLLSRGE
jgi:RNA methyltransferase, TrmH family